MRDPISFSNRLWVCMAVFLALWALEGAGGAAIHHRRSGAGGLSALGVLRRFMIQNSGAIGPAPRRILKSTMELFRTCSFI